MDLTIRGFENRDIEQMIGIWNEVVNDGEAFPQEEPLSLEEAKAFFGAQSFCAVAEAGGEIFGLYILHPNNVGRCGHISNASYAVKSSARGMRAGEKLVLHSLAKARELGFGILQFNAVVKTNERAIRLYKKLGFVELGTIPKGFRMDKGYEDIVVFYKTL